MDDNEVMAVISHKINHVLIPNSKDAMKNAYLTSAAKNAAGNGQPTILLLSCLILSWVIKLRLWLVHTVFAEAGGKRTDGFEFECG